jgi:outer membrane receptor protein involved in Fe transport
LCCAASAVAPPLLAQTTSATLIGTVRTAAGAEPVADAVIQARAESSGALRVAVTDAEGGYRLEALPPGSWTVVARLADGRVSGSQVVALGLQQTVRLDFAVGVADGLSEQVTVRAEAPLIDPGRTAGKLSIQREQVDRLPLAGRTFTDLARLDSTVQPSAPGTYFGERAAVFVVNGQSGRSNSFLVDGLDNNDKISGTDLNSFYSQQVIQEFVLLTHQYAPEFGRASGGVLNIVTRRGTNEHRWETFLQGTSDLLNSTGDFVESLPDGDVEQDSLRRYAVGFNFGGPIKRDRAFYFAAYEHQEADAVIPYTGIDENGQPGGRFVAPSENDSLFFRADFNLTQSSTLMVRLSANDRSDGGINVGGVNTPQSGFSFDEQDLALAAGLTSVIAPGTVYEARLLASTSSFDQIANSSASGVDRPSGIFGGNNLNRQERDEKVLQVVQNLTLGRGRHTMKFGVDVARSRTRIDTRFNPSGNFLYESDLPFEEGDCGGLFILAVFDAVSAGTWPVVPCTGLVGIDDNQDGFVDEPGIITTYPIVYQYIFGEPGATIEDTQIALFAQDRWQVTPRWLLDYGLRYDLSTYELPAGARVESSIPNGGAQRDGDNVAPRFGFTFTPKVGGKWLVRGGWGIFYDKLVLGFPAVASITSGTRIGLTFPQGLTFEINEDVVAEDGIDEVLEDLEFADELILRFSTGTELETPYNVQYNLGVERLVGRRNVVRANATRSQGYHIALLRDLNPVIDVNLLGFPEHRDPTTGSIAAVVTEGRNWYTGLDLSWHWRGDDGWVNTSYTWSKAEDMGFDPLKGGISMPPNPDDLDRERGRADGDRRHRLVVAGDTGLPFMGLRLSGSIQLSTGLPFNVTSGLDGTCYRVTGLPGECPFVPGTLDGVLTDRPAGVARNAGEESPLAAVNDLRSRYNEVLERINALHEGFDEEPLPMIGSLSEPGFAQVDVRLYRPFRFADGRGDGQFFLQVFNLFDRENAGLIEGRALSRNFGRPITLAGPPRTIELGFKVGR